MSITNLTNIAPSVIYITSHIQAAMMTGDPEERVNLLYEALGTLESIISVSEDEVTEILEDEEDD